LLGWSVPRTPKTGHVDMTLAIDDYGKLIFDVDPDDTILFRLQHPNPNYKVQYTFFDKDSPCGGPITVSKGHDVLCKISKSGRFVADVSIVDPTDPLVSTPGGGHWPGGKTGSVTPCKGCVSGEVSGTKFVPIADPLNNEIEIKCLGTTSVPNIPPSKVYLGAISKGITWVAPKEHSDFTVDFPLNFPATTPCVSMKGSPKYTISEGGMCTLGNLPGKFPYKIQACGNQVQVDGTVEVVVGPPPSEAKR
jgi:hypothetical protein